MSKKASIFGISRHRIGIDGKGVTTLVTFMKCPLYCKYCLNDICHKKDRDVSKTKYHLYKLTPRELYNKVKVDNLYFRATNGGITFGGGEPALYIEYIKEFRQLCGEGWKLNLETSLNYPIALLEKLQPIIDYFIIDIKDMSPTIYRNYTSMNNKYVLENLEYIAHIGRTNDTTIRVPRIPEYNNESDIEYSIRKLNSIGFAHIDKFTYINPLKNN